MEKWDIYNRDKELTGRIKRRGEKFENDEFRLVVHICIFNSENKMLIQQRQPFKDDWSNMWDITVGGCSLAGEDSRKTAERELFEEIGYAYDFKDENPVLTVNFKNGFDDIYIIKEDLDINDLNLQYEEVKAVKWADSKEINIMIEEGRFIPYHASYIELLFDLNAFDNNYRK